MSSRQGAGLGVGFSAAYAKAASSYAISCHHRYCRHSVGKTARRRTQTHMQVQRTGTRQTSTERASRSGHIHTTCRTAPSLPSPAARTQHSLVILVELLDGLLGGLDCESIGTAGGAGSWGRSKINAFEQSARALGSADECGRFVMSWRTERDQGGRGRRDERREIAETE